MSVGQIIAAIMGLLLFGVILSFVFAYIIVSLVIQIWPAYTHHFWTLFWLVWVIMFVSKFNITNKKSGD